MKIESKTQTQTFPSRAKAQSVIANLNAGTYYLSHGEYSRPHYTARKVRGEDSFYIYASRKFYADTVNARPSGPLTWEDI